MGDQPSEPQATAPSPRPPKDEVGSVSQQEPSKHIPESNFNAATIEFPQEAAERASAIWAVDLDARLNEATSKASHHLNHSRPDNHEECVKLVQHLADLLEECKKTSTDLEKRALYLKNHDGKSLHQGFKALQEMQALQEEAGEAIDNLHLVMTELEDPGEGKAKPFQATMAKLKEVIGQAQAAESDKKDLKTERQISNDRALEIQSLKDKCQKLEAGDFKTKIADLNSKISTLKKELRDAKYGAKATKFSLLDEKTNNFRAQTSHFIDHVNMRLLAFLTEWNTYQSARPVTWNAFISLRREFEKMSEDVQGAGSKVMALHE